MTTITTHSSSHPGKNWHRDPERTFKNSMVRAWFKCHMPYAVHIVRELQLDPLPAGLKGHTCRQAAKPPGRDVPFNSTKLRPSPMLWHLLLKAISGACKVGRSATAHKPLTWVRTDFSNNLRGMCTAGQSSLPFHFVFEIIVHLMPVEVTRKLTMKI